MLGLKRPWPNFIHRWPRSCAPGSSVIPDGPAVTTEQTDMIYTEIYYIYIYTLYIHIIYIYTHYIYIYTGERQKIDTQLVSKVSHHDISYHVLSISSQFHTLIVKIICMRANVVM